MSKGKVEYTFHYEDSLNYDPNHSITVKILDADGLKINAVLFKIAAFLKAVGHDFDEIEVRKLPKKEPRHDD